MDHFGGMCCCLGGLMGPLWSKSVDMGSLVRGGDRMGLVGGLTLDFRLMLPVVTYDQGRSGKMDCFGGMYYCLGV